jgi:D-tyrosyl-tRNA(Tyr) deacylase
MLAVIQRVTRASVSSGSTQIAAIGPGLLVLLGVAEGDSLRDAKYIAGKVSRLRIFEDGQKLMNLSVQDVAGSVLVVSQFTLLADTRKGNRPSFSGAAAPEQAESLYLEVIRELRDAGLEVQSGKFGAMMKVELINDGPVTIILNSK